MALNCPFPTELLRMKQTLVPALALAFLLGNLSLRAQDAPPTPTDPATPPVAETTPAPTEATPAPAETTPAPAETTPASTEVVVEMPKSDSPIGAGGEELGNFIIEDTPLPEVISGFLAQAGINAMIDREISEGSIDPATGQPVPPPSVSFRFENVTPANALSAVLEYNGLELVENKKTGIALIKKKDPNALPPLFTKVLQLQYSTTNVVQAVQATLSDTRSKVILDERTRQLVIVATETEMEETEKLINLLDTATKQVLIEARLIETASNPRSIKGIDWSGTLETQNFSFGNGTTSGSTTTTSPGGSTTTSTTLPGGQVITTTGNSAVSQATSLTTALGAGGLSLNTAGGFTPYTAFLNADGVKGILSFINSDTDTEVVATPRTVTLDNQQATLSVTRAFPIFEVTPGAANVPASASITYTNLGTILTVTPRIAANDSIHLKVVPEVSNIDRIDTQTIAGLQNTANVYAIRKIETEVMIPSGNTLVMGGLISDTSNKAFKKVPILGDIPGLGYFFRHENKSRSKANLIVFITPTIVQDYDFQYSPSDFLRNSINHEPQAKDYNEPSNEPPSSWDSARPVNWGTSTRSR